MSEEDKKDIFSPAFLAIKAIREKEGQRRKLVGESPCPTCGKALRYSIAGNGHIHGRCEGGETAFMM